MRGARSAGTAFLNLTYTLSTPICRGKTGGQPAKARPEGAASPAARLGRKRSAKTSIWPSTARVSAPVDSFHCRSQKIKNISKNVKKKKNAIFAVFDQLDVISYEEVVQLPAFKRKTLVLIGKHHTVL